ncbi:MAG: hypothetical protein U5N86_10665 [Planctomycetota bacterium]|nr:hypothetical protein [Planctomycetota bacterium]
MWRGHHVDQLAEGGMICIPVGDRAMQHLMVGRKVNGELNLRRDTGCVFVPLIGKNGWEDGTR